MENESVAAKTGVGPEAYLERPGIIDGSVTGGRHHLKVVSTLIMLKNLGNPRTGDGVSQHPA
jgi:hypothetical protein